MNTKSNLIAFVIAALALASSAYAEGPTYSESAKALKSIGTGVAPEAPFPERKSDENTAHESTNVVRLENGVLIKVRENHPSTVDSTVHGAICVDRLTASSTHVGDPTCDQVDIKKRVDIAIEPKVITPAPAIEGSKFRANETVTGTTPTFPVATIK